MKNLVFVMGSGRSGTTMLRDVLGKHSQVCALPETSFYDRLWAARHLLGGMNTARSRLRMAWLLFAACGDDGLIKQFSLRQEAVGEAFRDIENVDRESLFMAMCHALSDISQDTVIEKTPHHLLFMEDIMVGFPDAKFIYVTRDPLRMVESYTARGDLLANCGQVAMEWLVGNTIGYRCWKRYPQRVLHTKYEDITNDPVGEMTRIFSFIGKAFDESYLAIGSNSTFNQSGAAGIHKPTVPQGKLTESQAKEVTAMTSAMARQLDYDLPVLTTDFHLGWWVYRLNYWLKYRVCRAGFRPLRIMADRAAMHDMAAWVAGMQRKKR